MPMPRFVLNFLTCQLAIGLLSATACSHAAQSTPDASSDPDALDTAFGFEAKVQDVPIIQEDLGAQTDALSDAPHDTGVQTDVQSVAAQAAGAVKLGATTPLQVLVTSKAGAIGPPSGSEVVAFQVNGKALAPGATLAAKAADQSPVAIWLGTGPGNYVIAGVRPGTAKLVVTVDGVASAEVDIATAWPDGDVITGSTPGLSGSSTDKRIDEVAPDTAKLQGQLFAPGGVDATVRFPSTAQSGDSFDLGQSPAKGSLSVSLTIVSPAGLNIPATPVAGRVWLDQTDKGYFRGTLLGQTADLTPVVCAFVAERDGSYGVDLLDDPVLVETSSDTIPDSDLHASRAAINPIGNGKALLTWRRITNQAAAEIAMWVIDAKTGATVTNLPSLVKEQLGPFQAFPKDPVAYPTFGWVTAGVSNAKILLAWEGANGPDSFTTAAPTGVWIRGMEADYSLTNTGTFKAGQPIAVSDDACAGGCSPQIVALPNARFLVLWSPTTGGIRARRIEGDYSFTDGNPLQLLNPPATAASASVLDTTMGLMWRDPVQGSFVRVYTTNPAISSVDQEMQVGGVVANAPMPGVGIFDSPTAPGFLAFALDGSPATNLKVQRLDFSGIALGEIAVATGIGAIRVASGTAPQVVVLQTAADPKAALPLSIRKFTTTSPIDGGTQLGPVVSLGAKSAVPLLPSICYLPEVGIFVAAWSGDYKSEGVSFQRFR